MVQETKLDWVTRIADIYRPLAVRLFYVAEEPKGRWRTVRRSDKIMDAMR